MSLYKTRQKQFENLFDNDKIDMNELRALVHSGIPDCKKYRPVCWKLLLNYLDPNKKNWDEHLDRQRNNYKRLINDIVTVPGSTNGDHSMDHPLSEGPESSWSTFFKDNETFLLQIDKDVRRLCPDISFFQEPTKYPCETVVNSEGDDLRLHRRVAPVALSSANVERKGLGVTKINLILKRSAESYQAMEKGKEAHWEVVERMLFIYAKLNPGQGYVQGMNEIIGPIYYVFASNEEHAEFAEADCFYCFTSLMSEIRDFFIKSLDDSADGIKGQMAKLSNLLERKDPEVFRKLKEQELHPQYYSFRWLTLLLSQEFPLPDVLRLWDSIFADKSRFDFLIYICCAMIILMRNDILNQEFAYNVKLLQNYPPIDINDLLSKASFLRNNQ